jgi:hypothetical protein
MIFRSLLGARSIFGQLLGTNLFGLTAWSGYLAMTAKTDLGRAGLLLGSLFFGWAAFWWNFRLAFEKPYSQRVAELVDAIQTRRPGNRGL